MLPPLCDCPHPFYDREICPDCGLPLRLPDSHEFASRADGLAYLGRDGGSVPCSRYGRDSRECAPVAWRVAYLLSRKLTGDPITVAGLDHAMGLVVNDHDDVSYVVNAYGHGDYGRR